MLAQNTLFLNYNSLFKMNEKIDNNLQTPKNKKTQQIRRNIISSVTDSQNSLRAIDISRLISRKQRSRESKIVYKPVIPQKKKQTAIRHSYSPTKVRDSQISYSQSERYSTYNNKAIDMYKNINSLDQSFLTSNESNSIIGVLLYVLFIIFLIAETTATIYIVPQSQQTKSFLFEKTLLIILLSQIFYYLFLRFSIKFTKKKLFKYHSAKTSFDKLMQISKNVQILKQQQFTEKLISKPWLFLGLIALGVTLSSIFYTLAINSTSVHMDQDFTVISTIYWSSIALPYLFANFYLYRPNEDQTKQLKFFVGLAILYSCFLFMVSPFVFVLIVMNLFLAYFHSKKQFDVFHINQLIKGVLFTAFFMQLIIRYFITEDQSIFTIETLLLILNIIGSSLLLTIFLLITRILAIQYIKQQLYRYYYTQTSINIAFIISALTLVFISFLLSDDPQSGYLTNSIISILFQIAIGIAIYSQGKEQELLILNVQAIEEENY